MGYVLRNGLSFCLIENRAYFLDLPKDRYFCLANRANEALLALINDADNIQNRNDRAENILNDILQYTALDIALCPCENMLPEDDLYSHCATPRASLMDVSRAIYYNLLAMHYIKSRGLQFAINRVISVKNDDRGGKGLSIAKVAAAHQLAGRLIATHDRCLRRSIAFILDAGPRAGSLQLIFGIQNKPFGAHCWIQQGNIVLSDSVDKIRSFAPVLVI